MYYAKCTFKQKYFKLIAFFSVYVICTGMLILTGFTWFHTLCEVSSYCVPCTRLKLLRRIQVLKPAMLILSRVLVTNKTGSGLDERVYLLLIHT
jgi:hypothetical protein